MKEDKRRKPPKLRQPGFFDVQDRAEKLTKMGDPLVGLKGQIDWEAFRSDLERVHDKPRKSAAGAKPYDVVLMFKMLVLQQLHNLADEKVEYLVRDRFSFMRFLVSYGFSVDRFGEDFDERHSGFGGSTRGSPLVPSGG